MQNIDFKYQSKHDANEYRCITEILKTLIPKPAVQKFDEFTSYKRFML